MLAEIQSQIFKTNKELVDSVRVGKATCSELNRLNAKISKLIVTANLPVSEVNSSDVWFLEELIDRQFSRILEAKH